MPGDETHPFLFVSHANSDKHSPKFLTLLGRLHAAGIPLGIDRPYRLNGPSKEWGPADFVWSLDGRNEDWLQHVIRIMAAGACGIIVVASANTTRQSYVWQECLIATTLRIALNPNFGFFLLALEPGAHEQAPAELRSGTFMDADAELDGEIQRMRAHIDAERRRRAQRSDERRLADLAMKAMIRDLGTLRFFGGTQVPLDQIFTPLRGDMLAAAERLAAQEELLDPLHEWLHLQGPASREDRLTRLNAVRAVHIQRNPIMPGMPQGLAAAHDPFAVAGGTTRLSELVGRHGHAIVLGEPAAGKTTLLKWLALRFAEVWAATDDENRPEATVQALRAQVDPTVRYDEGDTAASAHVSLGPVRLPVFLSVPDLSARIRLHGASDLVAFLAMQLARLVDHIAFKDREDIARRVVIDALQRGRLLVLLDGLDEIAEQDRENTITLINQFAETWTSTGTAPEPSRDNRLFVTSRIVGYHALPLSASWPHLVVDRMTPAVVLDFWKRLYRSGAFGAVDAPDDSAVALHGSVYARHRGGVADLAGNPLLATLLARVFQENSQLPEHRTQIYDRALAAILKEQRKTSLPLTFVMRWLAPLAYDLQMADGPALIGHDALVDKLCKRLKTIAPDLGSDHAREKRAVEFIEENRLYLGLLVERSPLIWAFVHRTFQEYFAGLWLVEAVQGSGLDRPRLSDPRWREPLLLLLGSSAYSGVANAAARDAVFEALLDTGTDATGLAHVGRLLADALAEMPDLPSDRVLGRVVRAVLADLVHSDWQTLPAYARTRAIAALYAFGRREAARLETTLTAVLDEGPAAFSRAVACIVLDRHWCTLGLEAALRRAERYDSAAAGFPALQALQQVGSELQYGELGVSAKSTASERQLEAHHKAASAGIAHLAAAPGPNETLYQVVRQRADRSRYAFISRFDLFEAAVDTHLKRDSGAHIAATEGTSLPLLPTDFSREGGMRELLDTALGRAFEYRGRVASFLDYRRFVHFLGLNDAARHTALEYSPELRMMFGAEDPIYYLAVNLDLVFEPTFKDLAPPYLARPEAGPSTPLQPYVAELLRPSRGWLSELIGRVRRARARRGLSPTDYARTVLCEALADLAGAKIARALIGAADTPRRQALEHLLQTTLAAARDTVLHAGQHLAAQLHDVAAQDEVAAIQALDTTCRLVPGVPLPVSEKVGPSHARVFAERIAYRLLGLEQHERRYAAAVALDAQTGLTTGLLLRVLQAFCESAASGWMAARGGMGVGAPWPIDLDGSEITLAVLDMATSIDAGDDMSLRAAQASTLFDRMSAQSGLSAASLTPFATLPRSVLSWSLRLEDAAAIVEAAGDPYHKARFALGLFEARHATEGPALAAALLPDIANPVLRLDIAERLAKLVQDPEAARYRTAAVAAARSIADPAQRWRALLRLSWQPGYAEQTLLRESIAALDTIADPAELKADAHSITRLIARRTGGMRATTPRLSNRSIPIGLRHGRLASCFTTILRGYGDAGSILYIAQTCADLLDACEADRHRSATGQDENAGRGTTNAADLTVALAEQLYCLADTERAGAASPSTAIARAKHLCLRAGFSLYAGERWLDRPEHPLAWIAAIAIVKTRARRDRRVLEPLLHAVRADDEEIAAQAACMLSRGCLLVRRAAPDTAFDDMTLDTLLWIGRRGIAPGDRDLRTILALLVADTRFAGAAPIGQLLAHLDAVAADRAAVLFVLENISWTDAAAADALMHCLRRGDAGLQAAIISSLATIDLSQRVEQKPKEPTPQKTALSFIRPIAAERLADAFRDMPATADAAPFLILAEGGASLCQLIEQTCLNEPRSERRVAAFHAALTNARLDIRTSLVEPESVYGALEMFLNAKSYAAGQALPFRHDRQNCHALRSRIGEDAVHLAVALLIDLAESADAERELAGLLATLCVEFALTNPSLVASAFRSRLGTEAQLGNFLARLIDAPPRGVSITTSITLACLLRPLDSACVEALIAVSRRPDFGDWVLLEQSLLGVGRVEPSTLPLIRATAHSPRPRTGLLALRLLGSLARDVSAGGDTRRAARQALENIAASTAPAEVIHIYAPGTRDKDEGAVLRCGTLAEIAGTELFFADGARS